MNGYKIRPKVFCTYYTNKTAFESWNFAGYRNFMNYYNSKHNINIIETPYYINGKESLMETEIPLTIEKDLFIG